MIQVKSMPYQAMTSLPKCAKNNHIKWHRLASYPKKWTSFFVHQASVRSHWFRWEKARYHRYEDGLESIISPACSKSLSSCPCPPWRFTLSTLYWWLIGYCLWKLILETLLGFSIQQMFGLFHVTLGLSVNLDDCFSSAEFSLDFSPKPVGVSEIFSAFLFKSCEIAGQISRSTCRLLWWWSADLILDTIKNLSGEKMQHKPWRMSRYKIMSWRSPKHCVPLIVAVTQFALFMNVAVADNSPSFPLTTYHLKPISFSTNHLGS